MIITIDGPTASGKSTVARLVARKLNICYIASGLIYRAVAYELAKQYGYTSATIHEPLAQDYAHALNELHYSYMQGKEKLVVHGVDITPFLKTAEVDVLASIMSTNVAIREQINMYVRTLADSHSLVIDGRDCGTIIFPQATHKFYITASLAVRAQRWQAMQARLGNAFTVEQCTQMVHERDERDTTRAQSPLAIAAGAQVIDSSESSANKIADQICATIKGTHDT